MAWIRVIQPPEADEKLRGAYDEVGAARGTVANIMKIHSVSPDVMSAHLALYKRLMFGPSDLSRRQRETIGVVVSGANDCHY